MAKSGFLQRKEVPADRREVLDNLDRIDSVYADFLGDSAGCGDDEDGAGRGLDGSAGDVVAEPPSEEA